jgi:phage-related protein
VGKGISAMITIMAQVGVGAAKSFAESMVAVGKIATMFGDIASAVGSAGGALQAFGSFLFNAIVMGPQALIGAFASSFVSIGTAIVQGIASGITGAGGAIYSALSNAVQSAKASVEGALGIKSPSRVFADEVGSQMSAGMAVGITSGAERVRSAAAAVAVGAVPANTNGRAAGGSAGGVSVGSVTVMVNMGGGGGGGAAGSGGQPSGQAIGQDAAKAFWSEVRKLAEAG